jgi:hypothetical protein
MITLNDKAMDNLFAVTELNESELDGVSGGGTPLVAATLALGAAVVKLGAEVVRYVEYHTPEQKVITD